MIAFAVLLQMGFANPSNLYLPSATQARVDRSFSVVPIDTQLILARPTLKEERHDGCELRRNCTWVDKERVRYRFAGGDPDRLYLVSKTIRASDFLWKSIPAMGIGHARDRTLVIGFAQRFARGLLFDCGEPVQGPARCVANLDPGQVTIDFDERGQLIEVRFDGYGAG